MIGRLSGYVDYVGEESIILDVRGVGYEIFTPLSLKNNLENQSKTSLFIVTYVREDNIILFGFESDYDKKLFNLLTTVQGVGPKLALSIMNLNSHNITNAILLQQTNVFKSIAGVGTKVATRITNELKDKITKLSKNTHIQNIIKENNYDTYNMDISIQAITALKALGYSDKEAEPAIKYVLDNISTKNKNISVEDLVKQALKYFSKDS